MFWSRPVGALSNPGMLQDTTAQGKGDKRKRSSDRTWTWATLELCHYSFPFSRLSTLINHVRFPTASFWWFLIININIHPICLSMSSPMFFIISEGRPYLLWSANPVHSVQQRIECVTVCLVVMMSSFTSSLTICTVILPCCHSRTTRSLA